MSPFPMSTWSGYAQAMPCGTLSPLKGSATGGRGCSQNRWQDTNQSVKSDQSAVGRYPETCGCNEALGSRTKSGREKVKEGEQHPESWRSTWLSASAAEAGIFLGQTLDASAVTSTRAC